MAVKVVSFYRGRDIPASLGHLADKHANDLAEEMKSADVNFNEIEKHQLRHRELFLSRQIDTVNASLIRGKCTVRVLSEAENLRDYLKQNDVFFYTLVYDPQQKTLLADKGDIRVGDEYQVAHIPPVLDEGVTDPAFDEELEEPMWEPDRMEHEQIERLISISRSVGTFARALDKPSIAKMGLVDAASLASRDVTLLWAYHIIHQANYDFTKACELLIPNSGTKGEINVGPKFFRDQFEDWSKEEIHRFEEGNQKFQKEFIAIRENYLPWKEINSIIEFYYMWKTSDRCVDQKKRKMTEKEQKLKNVFIPPYTKASKLCMQESEMSEKLTKRPCESCCTYESPSWYPWGPNTMNCRLCVNCWKYWKKYGGLMLPASTRKNILVQRGDGKTFRFAGKTGGASGAPISAILPVGNDSKKNGAKHRQPGFYLKTTTLTKLMRQVCKDKLPRRSGAINPFKEISIEGIKETCQKRLKEEPDSGVLKRRQFESMDQILPRLHKKVNSPLVDSLLKTSYRPTQRKLNGGGDMEDCFVMKAGATIKKMRESCDIKRYARRPHATLIDLIKTKNTRNEPKKTNSNALNQTIITNTTTTAEEEDEEAMDTSESFPK